MELCKGKKGYPNPHLYVFPKKNARIIWWINDDFKIYDLRIYDICNQSRQRTLNYNLDLSDSFFLSSGNCLKDWKDWSLGDILLDIFKYQVLDKDVLKKIFIELGKIEEWSLRLSYFNGNHWSLNET